MGSEFSQEMRAMCDGGFEGNLQIKSDFFSRTSFGDQSQDLKFAIRKFAKARICGTGPMDRRAKILVDVQRPTKFAEGSHQHIAGRPDTLSL